MLDKILDYFHAHRKGFIALIPVLLPQFVSGNTADAIIIVLGLLGVVAVPNDEHAKRRVYRKGNR